VMRTTRGRPSQTCPQGTNRATLFLLEAHLSLFSSTPLHLSTHRQKPPGPLLPTPTYRTGVIFCQLLISSNFPLARCDVAETYICSYISRTGPFPDTRVIVLHPKLPEDIRRGSRLNNRPVFGVLPLNILLLAFAVNHRLPPSLAYQFRGGASAKGTTETDPTKGKGDSDLLVTSRHYPHSSSVEG
jgi:hypothetical protein